MNNLIQQSSLSELETIIGRALLIKGEAELEAGKALRKIRDEKLYLKNGYSSFDKYCREKWSYTRRWADRLISNLKMVEFFDSISDLRARPNGLVPPANESQSRQLEGLLPNQKIQVMSEVCASGKKVTAALIAEHAQKYKTVNIVEDLDQEVDEDIDQIESISPQELENEYQYSYEFELQEEEQKLEEEIENSNEEFSSKEALELCANYINQLHQEIALLQTENAELKTGLAITTMLLKRGEIKVSWTCGA